MGIGGSFDEFHRSIRGFAHFFGGVRDANQSQ